jgi:hypothetical protein
MLLAPLPRLLGLQAHLLRPLVSPLWVGSLQLAGRQVLPPSAGAPGLLEVLGVVPGEGGNETLPQDRRRRRRRRCDLLLMLLLERHQRCHGYLGLAPKIVSSLP